MSIRDLRRKIVITEALTSHSSLRKYVPESRWFNAKNLSEMLNRYSTVFIKPDTGCQGNGIIRVKRISKKRFQICIDRNCRKIQQEDLLPAIRKKMRSSSSYLIQRGIDLARYKGRPIDFRILMQKPRKHWEISGRVVRVAASGRFLTNWHKGGHAATVEKVLKRVLDRKSKISRIDRQLDRLSRTMAEVLDRRFPGIRELGLDIALDRSGLLWILEANTGPAYFLFKELKDKSMYKRIRRNHKYIKRVYS